MTSPHLRSLYICYLSLEDPLVETQVVAYLEGLAARGHVIHLLTFEVSRLTRQRRRTRRHSLAERGISWHGLRYHKRPSLPATVFDALAAAVFGAVISVRHRLDAVHARNHVPAVAGLVMKRVLGSKLIFDIRGLMAEEYEDTGRWRRGSIASRLTKRVERLAIEQSSGIVVLTERFRQQLAPIGARPSLFVIPCCADTDRIENQGEARARVRQALGLADRTVLVYVGKFTGWYMEREMVEFFAAARESFDRLHFLVLTQADAVPIVDEFARLDIAPREYTIMRSAASDVGSFLAAGDAAISLIRPLPSKISSSPTKIGEYLAAGLPIVSSAGVGDLDRLFSDNRAGVVLDQFTRAAYASAAARLAALVRDPGVKDHCRSLARDQLSLTHVGLPSYDRLYRHVAAS